MIEYAISVVGSFLDRLPRHLILFVTSRCNLKCKQCFYWEDMDINKGLKDIKLEEVRALARSKTLQKLLWLQLGGGEPFLRKDIGQIVEAFAELRELRHITIPTNGFYIDAVVEQAEMMARACPRIFINIDISIDGLHDEHDHIRGVKGSFEKLCRTIVKLKEVRSRHRNLGIGVILVQMAQNQAHLESVLEYVIKDIQPDHVALNLVRGNPREKVSGDGIDMEIYRRLCQRIEDAHVRRELSDFDTPLGSINVAKDSLLHDVIHETRKAGFQMYCKAGTLSLVIKDAGDVFACEILPDCLGNIRTAPLDEIWAGAAAQRLRGWIRDAKCHCTHECFFTSNIAFNPLMYPKLLAKTASVALKRASGR